MKYKCIETPIEVDVFGNKYPFKKGDICDLEWFKLYDEYFDMNKKFSIRKEILEKYFISLQEEREEKLNDLGI